ncbi:MAG: hypothetical protein IJD62_01380, partial [Oscillospiraceae bacterium]|nr:hypothetical protein [Oscillospiraceae bacterium]
TGFIRPLLNLILPIQPFVFSASASAGMGPITFFGSSLPFKQYSQKTSRFWSIIRSSHKDFYK